MQQQPMVPMQPMYQQPQEKSFTNQAVITFVLFWAFWLPGVVAAMIWWNEAYNYMNRTGTRPEGYTALLIELIIGVLPVLCVIAFIVAVILWAIFAAITGGH